MIEDPDGLGAWEANGGDDSPFNVVMVAHAVGKLSDDDYFTIFYKIHRKEE